MVLLLILGCSWRLQLHVTIEIVTFNIQEEKHYCNIQTGYQHAAKKSLNHKKSDRAGEACTGQTRREALDVMGCYVG